MYTGRQLTIGAAAAVDIGIGHGRRHMPAVADRAGNRLAAADHIAGYTVADRHTVAPPARSSLLAEGGRETVAADRENGLAVDIHPAEDSRHTAGCCTDRRVRT